MNVLVLMVLLIFGIMMIVGFQRGLFKAAVGMTATLLTLLIVYLVAPVVFQYVTDNTELDEKLEVVIFEKIRTTLEGEIKQRLVDEGDFSSQEELDKATKRETEKQLLQNPDRSEQTELISLQSIPEFMKKKLLENNNVDVYDALGVENVYHYISRSVALSVVNVAVTISLFVLVRLLLLIFSLIIDGILDNIPILSGLNHLGGMLLGACGAMVIVWIIMVAYSLLDGEAYEIMLGQSAILARMDALNLIAKMLYRMGV